MELETAKNFIKSFEKSAHKKSPQFKVIRKQLENFIKNAQTQNYGYLTADSETAFYKIILGSEILYTFWMEQYNTDNYFDLRLLKELGQFDEKILDVLRHRHDYLKKFVKMRKAGIVECDWLYSNHGVLDIFDLALADEIGVNQQLYARLKSLDLSDMYTFLKLNKTTWDLLITKSNPQAYVKIIEIMRFTAITVVKILSLEDPNKLCAALGKITDPTLCTEFMFNALFRRIDDSEALATAFNILIEASYEHERMKHGGVYSGLWKTANATLCLDLDVHSAIVRSKKPVELAQVVSTSRINVLKFLPLLEGSNDPKKLLATLKTINLDTYMKGLGLKEYEVILKQDKPEEYIDVLINLKIKNGYSDDEIKQVLECEPTLAILKSSEAKPRAKQSGYKIHVLFACEPTREAVITVPTPRNV